MATRQLIVLLAWAILSLDFILGVGSIAGSGSVLAQSTPVYGCGDSYGTPPTGNVSTELVDIAAVSEDNIWAVGEYSGPSPLTLFSLHWDGHTWNQVYMPSPGDVTRELRAVDAISANDVWAVGYYSETGVAKTLTMHWDGFEWKHVLIPGLGDLGYLTGVSGVASNDVWAVGSFYNPDLRHDLPIVLHWDGKEWTPADIPFNEKEATHLQGVFARAADDVWAVGIIGLNPYFLHWDGKEWSIAPNAIVPPYTQLTDVYAVSRNSAWAVGGSSEGPVIMHWDGDDWRRESISDMVGFPSDLSAITAFSANDVWAVGTEAVIVKYADIRKLLVMRWDGVRWSRVPSDVSGSAATAQGVDSTSDGSIWVAGSFFNPANLLREPLLLRVDSKPCQPPTATPTPHVTPLDPPVSLPGTNSVTFPETGKTIRGVFLEYWQRNGGILQQGYPISNVMGEISDLDGRAYTVQYFERAVFELHPENQPPYNVLLSQLGKFHYKQKYPNGAPNQRANPDAGTRYFPETGKHLGGAFHYYWVNNGGLAQQGYPISEEFQERSPLDGRVYTVQYFERAVFEYHPENQPPFEVLLSQLGRFRYDERYRVPVTPTPMVSPIPR